MFLEIGFKIVAERFFLTIVFIDTDNKGYLEIRFFEPYGILKYTFFAITSL